MTKYSQKSIIGKTRLFIQKNNLILPKEKIMVAVSGGADSVALLNILLKLKDELNCEISVCHFNHLLRGKASDRDETFVKEICKEKKLECVVGRAERAGQYKSEDKAREARYLFFEKILEEGRADKVALAHQQNDSAETVLLRLIRGTGLRGLRSIPASRQKFIRPLLNISRTEIEQYLSAERIAYCTDETNADTKFLRNKIRLEVLPALKRLNPNITATLAETARSISCDYIYIVESAEATLEKIAKIENNSIEIDLIPWQKLPESQRKMTLRVALTRLSPELLDVTADQIDQVEEMLMQGKGGKHKLLPHSLRVALTRGRIILSINKKKEIK